MYNYKKKYLWGKFLILELERRSKIKKIIKKICSLTKKVNPEFGKLKMRKDETLKIFPNIKKIKILLNWKAKVSLKKGLQKTLRFYIKGFT